MSKRFREYVMDFVAPVAGAGLALGAVELAEENFDFMEHSEIGYEPVLFHGIPLVLGAYGTDLLNKKINGNERFNDKGNHFYQAAFLSAPGFVGAFGIMDILEDMPFANEIGYGVGVGFGGLITNQFYANKNLRN